MHQIHGEELTGALVLSRLINYFFINPLPHEVSISTKIQTVFWCVAYQFRWYTTFMILWPHNTIFCISLIIPKRSSWRASQDNPEQRKTWWNISPVLKFGRRKAVGRKAVLEIFKNCELINQNLFNRQVLYNSIFVRVALATFHSSAVEIKKHLGYSLSR